MCYSNLWILLNYRKLICLIGFIINLKLQIFFNKRFLICINAFMNMA